MLERNQVHLGKIHRMLESLPLQGSTLERCLASNEIGRKAPVGKAFKMSGQFWLQQDYFNNYSNAAPLQSTDLFIAGNQEHYDFLLAEFGGDTERALEELRNDVGDSEFDFEDVPSEFVGKWLVVRVGRPISIRVKQDPIVWLERQNMRINDDLDEATKKQQIVINDYGDGELIWNQYYADGILGECKIELVDYEETAPKLYIPDPIDKTKIEQVNYLRNPTSREYSAYYAPVLGRHLTEEERLNFMRNRRWWGEPLDDDLLKHFEMPNRRVLEPEVPKVILPERPLRRWIIKPGQEELADKYLSGKLDF